MRINTLQPDATVFINLTENMEQKKTDVKSVYAIQFHYVKLLNWLPC